LQIYAEMTTSALCILHSTVFLHSSSSKTAETKEQQKAQPWSSIGYRQPPLANLFITPFSTLSNTDFKYSQKTCLIACTEFLSLFKRRRWLVWVSFKPPL